MTGEWTGGISQRSGQRGQKAAKFLRSASGHPGVFYDKETGMVVVPGLVDLVVSLDKSRQEPIRLARGGASVIYVAGVRTGVSTELFTPKSAADYVVALPFTVYAELLRAVVDRDVMPRIAGKE